MANQAIGELMETAMEKIRSMVDSNTVIGNPITTLDGITLIPVSRLTFGFASGGSDKSNTQSGVWGGSGAAVKVEPVGFLVNRDGGTRMLSIQPPAFTTTDRLLDMVPELVDKLEHYLEKQEQKNTAME